MKGGEKSTKVGAILQSGLRRIKENMFYLVLHFGLSVICNYKKKKLKLTIWSSDRLYLSN